MVSLVADGYTYKITLLVKGLVVRGFRQSEIQDSLFSYRDQLEKRNFACSKLRYGTLQNANNKGADQTAWMRRLFCVRVVRNSPKTCFLASRPS